MGSLGVIIDWNIIRQISPGTEKRLGGQVTDTHTDRHTHTEADRPCVCVCVYVCGPVPPKAIIIVILFYYKDLFGARLHKH